MRFIFLFFIYFVLTISWVSGQTLPLKPTNCAASLIEVQGNSSQPLCESVPVTGQTRTYRLQYENSCLTNQNVLLTSFSWSVTGGNILGNNTEQEIEVQWYQTGEQVISVEVETTDANNQVFVTSFEQSLEVAYPVTYPDCTANIIQDNNLVFIGNQVPEVYKGKIYTYTYDLGGYCMGTPMKAYWCVKGGEFIGSSTGASVQIKWTSFEKPNKIYLQLVPDNSQIITIPLYSVNIEQEVKVLDACNIDFGPTDISANTYLGCGQFFLEAHPFFADAVYEWFKIEGNTEIPLNSVSGNMMTHYRATLGTDIIKLRIHNLLCEATPYTNIFYTLTVLPVPSVSFVPTINIPSNCGTKALTYSGVATGTWYWQTTPTGTSQSNNSTLHITQSGIYYLRPTIPCASGGWVWGKESDVIATPYITLLPTTAPPVNLTNPATINGEGEITMFVGGANRYIWYEGTNCCGAPIAGVTGNSYKVNLANGQTRSFWVKAVNDNPACAESAPVQITVNSITLPALPTLSQADMNYIRVLVPLKPLTEASQLLTLNANEVTRHVTYFDGLGRVIQTVGTQASPTMHDIIQPTKYDNFGRVTEQYLPYTGIGLANGKTGVYQSQALMTNYGESQQFKFYNQNAPQGVTTDEKPYAKSYYEASPLNRVVKTEAVGKNWQNKFTTSDYAIYAKDVYASQDNIPIWRYDLDNKTIVCDGEYANNTLVVSTGINPEAMKSSEYTDAKGQNVLKRVYGENQEIHETMYVYDAFGQLRAVFPPMAMEKLRIKQEMLGQWQASADILDTYCFLYNYDARQRIVETKEPQKGWEYIVYDELSRPILTQDALQRKGNDNQWNFTKFDVLGRVINTGFINFYGKPASVSEIRQWVQNQVDAHFDNDPTNHSFYEIFLGTDKPNHGYSGTNAYPTFGNSAYSLEYTTFTYYDDYSKLSTEGVAIHKPFATSPYHTTYFGRLIGKVVATKVKVLEQNKRADDVAKWLETVPYYDDRGRAIQTIADNNLVPDNTLPNNAQKGKDIMHMKYDYAKLTEDKLEHRGGAKPLDVVQEYAYNGTWLHSLYHTITYDGTTFPRERLVTYQYNELGQVITKTVGTNKLQNIDFTYTIQGSLKRINDLNATNATNDLFHFELFYETGMSIDPNDTELGKGLYNGLIAGQKWKSALDGQTRGYAYKYDKFGRLKEARYKYFGTGINTERFSVSNLSYDKNGNILRMNREGAVRFDMPTISNPTGYTFGAVDALTYTYNGNQVTNIKDGIQNTTGIAGDFQDNDATNPQNTEYQYDENGNLTADLNKKIVAIYYNENGKAIQILYENARRETDEINYLYDAIGIKLRKETKRWNATTNLYEYIKTDYVGGIVYTDLALTFLATPEGKALAPNQLGNKSGAFAYEYNYTDHLGNLRMTFREGQNATYEAGMETLKATEERREFANIDRTRNAERVEVLVQGNTRSAKVITTNNPRTNSPLGPWKSLPVLKGDKVSVNVRAYFEQIPRNNPISLANVIQILGSAYGAVGMPNNETSPFDPTKLLVGLTIVPTNPNRNGSQTFPTAYLNIVEYNEAGTVVASEYRHVARQNIWHDLRVETYTAKGKGRIEIFVANESETPVWFDNLRISYTPTLIAQETHYDPWGLELTGIGADGHNRYTFNAQSEKQKELGVNKGYFFETDWRGYDAQVGRFWQMDKLAQMYHFITPYNFGGNNPISINDPTGLYWVFDSKSMTFIWINGEEGKSDEEHFKTTDLAKDGTGKFVGNAVLTVTENGETKYYAPDGEAYDSMSLPEVVLTAKKTQENKYATAYAEAKKNCPDCFMSTDPTSSEAMIGYSIAGIAALPSPSLTTVVPELASIGWSAITTRGGQELTQQIVSNLIAGKPVTNIDVFDVVLKTGWLPNTKIGGVEVPLYDIILGALVDVKVSGISVAGINKDNDHVGIDLVMKGANTALNIVSPPVGSMQQAGVYLRSTLMKGISLLYKESVSDGKK